MTEQLDEALTALTRKGEQASAAPAEPDWAKKPRAPVWLPRRALAWAISQFHHAELATADICEALADRLDGPEREFLLTQVNDERRHAELYRRYLGKIGCVTTVCPALGDAYDAVRIWDGPPAAQVLAIHVILEGESLHLQKTVTRWLPCPLFGDISRLVAIDEARHQAFGRLYLHHALPSLTFDERLEMFRWLERLWIGAVTALAARLARPGFFSRGNSRSAWMTKAFARHSAELERLGLFAAHERRLFAAVSELLP